MSATNFSFHALHIPDLRVKMIKQEIMAQITKIIAIILLSISTAIITIILLLFLLLFVLLSIYYHDILAIV